VKRRRGATSSRISRFAACGAALGRGRRVVQA
jgi:hypothetical protein